ncbi:dTDP-4-dehydrorhamnose reductase [Cognatiyoonia sp. IB215446]|uniref:dTDP-4-dehydrorhamnose reductase n=1 Tax=Cognatiyoonia sp. IB215446 TaxID=3097355 RepID=UPI002A1612C8|nr:dTDP-4-dehydrorhamnose reductase [Cognatiyoonia sp. IB215446]MDX8349241.1 dTDP-4-dehydrorhamnose reductase [Cognatiyoonia sp. IB215446]
MKVLVFGKTGQVARALMASGPAHGVTITALGREEADLADPQACADRIAASDVDAVINAAAWTAVDAAEEEEDAAFVINAEAPGAMARACAAKDIPFVHISTDYVFDGSEGAPWLPTDPTHPLGAYGRTKLAGEEQVTDAGGTSVILRTAWVFDGTGKNFVTTMLRLSETRDTLTIVADQNGGPTPAAAIADACLRIAKDLAAGLGKTGIYHFSGTPDTTWADFARVIFATAGRDVTVKDIATADYPTPAKRPANSRLDCTSLAADYGIKRPDWQAALTEILARRSTS